MHATGEAAVLGIVVVTEGSTYQKPGALVLLDARGLRHGVISGGCLEPELELRAREVFIGARATVVEFDTRSDEDLVFGSGTGCRGRVKLLLLPQAARAPLTEAFFKWRNLRLVLVVLLGLLMSQGVVWYTAQFYTQFFLERVIKVEPRVVNELILSVTVVSAGLHILFARLSDRVGRKPVMLFGLALATLLFIPGFHWLTKAVNPGLTEAIARAPVTVFAAPADCSFQFDLIGKAKFASSCDIAKSTLASAGIPYTNRSAMPGGKARVQIGARIVTSPNGSGLDAAQLAGEKKRFAQTLDQALNAAHYPAAADPRAVDVPRTLALLLVFIVAASALYGPQAAALVELFPTRIRYSALSFPYHVGVGWFGGFLPVTAYAIVVATGNIYAGLWYPTIIAAISFVVSLVFLPETRARDIET